MSIWVPQNLWNSTYDIRYNVEYLTCGKILMADSLVYRVEPKRKINYLNLKIN